jgi:hypothetical protein
VLDVGTGADHAALALAPRAAEVIALDLTEQIAVGGRRPGGPARLSNVVPARPARRCPSPTAHRL